MARMSGWICQDEYKAKLDYLTDAELGRLTRALMDYHIDGSLPDLRGREIGAFYFIKNDIDIAEAKYDQKCRQNSRNRNNGTTTDNDGQRRTMTDNDRERPMTTDDERERTSTNNNKNKNNNENVNVNDSSSSDTRACVYERAGLGDLLTDEELEHARRITCEDIPAIERLMVDCGVKFAPADETIARDLLTEYTCEQILKAIRIAKESNAVNWRYIKGVLRKQKEGFVNGSKGRNGARTTAGRDAEHSGDMQDPFDAYLASTFV